MKSISRILGIIGLIALAFGLGVGLYTGTFRSAYVLINLVAGGVFALLAAILNFQDLKAALLGRSSRAGANALIYAAGVLAILVLVNFIAARNHKRWDLTENRVYSLSDSTLNLMRDLTQDVRVIGFFVGGQAGAIEDLLGSYRYANDKRFSWEVVDPDKRPELAERYAIRQNATLVVEVGEDRKTLQQVNAATLEESLTNAILNITAVGKKTLCTVQGHGERSLSDAQTEFGYALAAQALEGENYALKPLILAAAPAVPDDCTVVLVAGPEKPYLESETATLQAYLERGGSLYVLLDPRVGGPLNELLARWGIKVGNDVVVDRVLRLFEGESLGLQPVVTSYDAEHPITREFQKQTVLTQARSVSPGVAPEGYAATAIMKSGATGWGETEIDRLYDTGEVELDNKDLQGPVPLAVAVGPATGEEREGKAKIVVIGDADLVSNRFAQAFFNSDFFLNAANWLTDLEKQIAIRPKGPRASFVRLTDEQMSNVFNFAVLIFPQLLLTLGIVVGWRRR